VASLSATPSSLARDEEEGLLNETCKDGVDDDASESKCSCFAAAALFAFIFSLAALGLVALVAYDKWGNPIRQMQSDAFHQEANVSEWITPHATTSANARFATTLPPSETVTPAAQQENGIAARSTTGALSARTATTLLPSKTTAATSAEISRDAPKFAFHFSGGDWSTGASTNQFATWNVADDAQEKAPDASASALRGGSAKSTPAHRGASEQPPSSSLMLHSERATTTAPRQPSTSPSAQLEHRGPKKAPSYAGPGACTTGHNWQLWLHGGAREFQKDMNVCATQCLGDSSCTGDCFSKRQGYSAMCARCMGDLASCSRDNCMFQCIGGKSDGCSSCVRENCEPQYQSCAGINLDKI